MVRRFIFLLNSKSKLSRAFCESRKPARLVRRSRRRSARRRSSSETSTEIRSMGAMCSFWAWSRRFSRTEAIPPKRSCLRARSSSTRFIGTLLGHAVDVVAVQSQLADQRVDLAKRQRRAGAALQVAAGEAVGRHAHLQGGGAGVLDGDAVPAHQRAHAEDALDAPLALVSVDRR